MIKIFQVKTYENGLLEDIYEISVYGKTSNDIDRKLSQIDSKISLDYEDFDLILIETILA